MAESIGQRVYLVRLALGDGVRDALPMRDFADLLTRTAGKSYSASKVSDLETGKRRLSLEDATLIASVDPRKRGRAWLAWGDEPAAGRAATPADSRPVTVPHPAAVVGVPRPVKDVTQPAKKKGRGA